MKKITIMACCMAWAAGGAGAQDQTGWQIIPAADAKVRAGLSPYNWVCREHDISSTVCGASLDVGFKGTRRVSLMVDTAHIKQATASAKRYPIVEWSVNGGPLQIRQLAAGEQAIMLVSNTPDPVINLYIKGMSPFENRYQGDVPGTALKITGFAVDRGGRTTAVALPKKIWLNIGDSIMSGDGAAYATNQGRPPDDQWAESDDGRACYGYRLAEHYGFRESRIAYGGYNWNGGLGHVPPLVTLIDQRTSTVKRLEGDKLSPAPDVVLINLGENGAPADRDVVAALGKVRARVRPDTKIVLMVPLSGRGRAEVTRAFNTYRAAAKDKAILLVDLGPVTFTTCDGQHPDAAGHKAVYQAALPLLDPIIKGRK